MACELWLVRHGQAAFGTEDYDRLTELGWQQARWLGAHLAGRRFSRIAAGRLRRQRETAEALNEHLGGDLETVTGLEEYDADGLLAALGIDDRMALGRRDHFRQLRIAMQRWADGRIDPGESWAAFNDRIAAAIADLTARDGPVIAASSGGTIAAVVAQALGLGAAQMIELNLQARNTGITRLVFTSRGAYLNMFNAVPHLEHPDRAHAETYS